MSNLIYDVHNNIAPDNIKNMFKELLLVQRGVVSEETVVLRRWGSETRKFGLSTEFIM